MDSIVTYYLLWQFLKTLLLVLFGLAGLLIVFDILANADTVLENHSSVSGPLLFYTVLRLPQIITLLIPMSVLFSVTIVLVRMVLSQEITALRAVGMPVYSIAGRFVLGGVIVCGLHFMFANSILPTSATYLRLWADQDYQGLPHTINLRDRDARGWFASDQYFVSAKTASPDGRVLYDVEIIERGQDGIIVQVYKTERAEYDGMEWQFTNLSPLSEMLRLVFKPAAFKAIHETEAEMTYSELALLLEKQSFGQQMDGRYQTWYNFKLARPLSSILMILIAAPMALQMGARGRIYKVVFWIIFFGFVYFILENLFLSFGETGALSPLLSVWAPPGFGLLMSVWILLLLEG